MAKSAGVIRVSFEAGTGNFIADVKKGTASVREFGTVAKGSSLQANAAIRALEGNFQSNTRAVSLFLRETLKLGPALGAAFQLVGPILFAKVLFDIGNKVHEFFKNMQDESRQAAIAFRQLIVPIQLSNAELKVSNDRLDNEIAKLEGRRQNTLKLALDEATASAIKLANALDESLAKFDKVYKEQAAEMFDKIIFGAEGSEDTLKYIHYIRELLAGTKDAAGQTLILEQAIGHLKDRIDTANQSAARYKSATGLTQGPSFEETKNLRVLTTAQALLESELEHVGSQAASELKTKTKEGLEAGIEAARLEIPFDVALAKLDAKLTGLRAELASVGSSEEAKQFAKGFSDGVEAITKLNDKLKEQHPLLGSNQATLAQQVALMDDSFRIADAEAKLETAKKSEDQVRKLNEEAVAYREIASAIGLTYEATRRAAIQAAIVKTPGYGKPGFDLLGITGAETRKFDAEHLANTSRTLDGLNRQIALTRQLADVAAQGATAERLVELHAEQALALREGNWPKVIALAIQYDQDRRKGDNTELAAINLKIAATNRLAAAVGERGKQEAEAENKRQEVLFHGAGAGVGAAEYQLKFAEEQLKIAEEGNRLANQYTDQLANIDKLEAQIVLHARDQMQLSIALREQDQARLKAEVEYALAQRTLSSGVHAFFLDMQRDAVSAGQLVYQSLHTALDQISNEFGKLLTGQVKKGDVGKTFGKVFQNVGGELVGGSIKSVAQLGLGKLGGVLGIHGLGQPLLSKGNPGYVYVLGGGAGGALGGAIGGLFHTEGANEGSGEGSQILNSGLAAGIKYLIHNFHDLTGLAGGGNVSSGGAYLVGENGPEIFSPRSSGAIIPMSHIGGGTTYIDARGADLGVLNRISRAQEATGRTAVSGSVQAVNERNHRTPQVRHGRG